jgi:predicted nucleotidyltransferase
LKGAALRVGTDLIQEITRRLVAEFDPEQIFLFGSYAWGIPNEDSDVDLLVIVTQSDARLPGLARHPRSARHSGQDP